MSQTQMPHRSELFKPVQTTSCPWERVDMMLSKSNGREEGYEMYEGSFHVVDPMSNCCALFIFHAGIMPCYCFAILSLSRQNQCVRRAKEGCLFCPCLMFYIRQGNGEKGGQQSVCIGGRGRCGRYR